MTSRPHRDEEDVPEEVGWASGRLALDTQRCATDERVRVLVDEVLLLRVDELVQVPLLLVDEAASTDGVELVLVLLQLHL